MHVVSERVASKLDMSKPELTLSECCMCVIYVVKRA